MSTTPKTSDSSPAVFHITGGGTHISVTSRGASWLSCELELGDKHAEGGAPDVGKAARREILLGHANPAMYGTQPGYLGAIVGRYANRIAGAGFPGLQGEIHALVPNEGVNQLHGGPDGFDKRDWHLLSHSRSKLILGLESPAGDQGFPGNLQAQVTYEISENGTVTIRFDTSVDAPCPVNLSSHAYFNLNGSSEPGGASDVLNHTLYMAAKRYLPVDARLIPTGELAPVQGTPFDFNQPTRIGAALSQAHAQLSLGGGGVDHGYVLDAACGEGAAPAARLTSADGRLAMTMFTSYPGLQCYTGNYLTGLPGRTGRPLSRHAGLALEPEYFPDSPNHPEWMQPSCWQQAGEARSHFIRLEFERTAGLA